jgi:major membrane immunogen (membrane-anchored lipoprotein)
MRKKTVTAAAAVMAAAMFLAGCKDSSPVKKTYKDGVYTAVSGEDERGAYGEVTITVESGKITNCKFVTWQQDGTVKGEDYGKINGEISNREYYDKAQLAVKAMDKYASDLVKEQTPDKVDAVSGATVSHDQFVEASRAALKDA